MNDDKEISDEIDDMHTYRIKYELWDEVVDSVDERYLYEIHLISVLYWIYSIPKQIQLNKLQQSYKSRIIVIIDNL